MNKKKVILGCGIFVALILAMVLIWTNFREKPSEPKKNETYKEVTIEVVNSKGESTVYEVKTEEQYLRGAMDDAKEKGLEFSGDEGEYGLMIHTINGERAVYNEGAYWYFYVNDGECGYGVDEQPVKNGDAFKIVYTKTQ